MPRPVWTGAISFGLVNVPIRLYTATEKKDVRFRELHRDTGERIRHKRVAEGSGEEVPYEEIVKGYQLDGDRFVVVEPEELDVLQPEKSNAIAVEDFVDLSDIDPIYFDRTYYLAPPDQPAARRAYALLLRAMEDTGKVGIGRFVMRTKEYLAAVRASDGALVLETMYFADEIRERKRIDGLPVDEDPDERELDVARRLIESLSSGFAPDRYRDTHREAVLDLVERKAEGEETTVARPAAEPEAVDDLMAALRASLERVEGGGGSGGRDAAGDGHQRTSGPATGEPELRQRSRDELYEEAQRRDIPGRSKMSKDELIEALTEAS